MIKGSDMLKNIVRVGAILLFIITGFILISIPTGGSQNSAQVPEEGIRAEMGATR